MLQNLILFLLFLFLSGKVVAQEEATSRFQSSMGVGLLSRVDREVNPDFREVHHMPELYGKLHKERWGLVLDLGHEKLDSSSGSMRIKHESTTLNTWARYDLDRNTNWAPFATAGVGLNLDRVTSSYGSAIDKREGHRGLLGMGAGLTGTWGKWEAEIEGRLSFMQDRKDPEIAALFRLGYVILN
jgi:hypothetical protein